MMSTRRAPRLPLATADGAVVEDIHALPTVIVLSSVSVVVAARRVRYNEPTHTGRPNLQNLRPHQVKRRQVVKTIIVSVK
jgi:hypothetical protein